jgi:hypothetical protein
MRIYRAFQNPIQEPCFDQVDGAGGGGAAGSGGSPSGGFQPGQAGAAGGGIATSGGVGTPVALADDTPISVDGKTLTWKEYRSSQFVPKSDYDNVKQLTRREIENNLRTLAQRMASQQRPAQPQGPRVDPFADVRGLPLVDGDTLAKLAENGFGQVGQNLQHQQRVIQQLAAQVQKLQGGVGTLAKERSGQERTSRVAQAIASMGEGFDPKDEFLQDIAQDVLDAWEFDKPDDFPPMFAKRIQAAEKWFRARDKAKLEKAKTTRFLRPGGSGSPSGAARPDPRMMASQAADILFGPRSSTRT